MRRFSIWIIVALSLILVGLSAVLAYVLWPKSATDTVNPPATEQPAVHTYTSANGVTIQLNEWLDTKRVTSPLTVTGSVPGSWSFEAVFPVKLLASDGEVLAEGSARLQDDWMTEALVPFTVTLTFDMPTTRETGTFVLEKSNPSDLATNNDSVEVPVRF